MIGLIILLCIIGVQAYTEMASNVANNLPIADKYPNALKMLLLHLNSVEFTRLSATDFIFKNYFSFFAIFMVLIAADIFAIDKERGTMKFAILSGITPTQIYAGKLISALTVTMGVTLINFAVAFILGLICIGGNIIPMDLLSVFGIYLSASVPGMAVVTIISVLSLLPANSKILIGGGRISVFVLGLFDSMNIAGESLSPIGLLSAFGNDIPVTNAGFFASLFTSFAYTIVFIIILMAAVKRIDYFD
jgi:ABC-type transport system involved in multi-copper enzyme maturation permease subunit